MSFRIEIGATAARDLREIFRWLSERSTQGAASWQRAFSVTVGKLESSADCFGIAPEDADHEITVRQAFFKTRRGRMFRIVFVVRQATAYVLFVRASNRDLIPPESFQFPPE